MNIIIISNFFAPGTVYTLSIPEDDFAEFATSKQFFRSLSDIQNDDDGIANLDIFEVGVQIDYLSTLSNYL